MEEDMVEDTENQEEEEEYIFTAYEIDLDYEFDAARYFDFSREESHLEASQAELWFESAGSYPPSPFVESLVSREDLLMKNINISPKSKGVEAMNLCISDSDVEADPEISATVLNYREQHGKGTSSSHIGRHQKFQNQYQKLPIGSASYYPMVKTGNPEDQTKISKKPAFPRNSTLLKPTASQLAKQNRPFQASHSRSCVAVLDKTSKSGTGSCMVENQAAKRQKLEGGLLRKVMGTAQLQQANYVHKASRRDGLLDENMTHTKPRITIPRDPDLETAHRAQRTRGKSSKDENATSMFGTFKALPLNRKIFEAPSLVPKRSAPRLPDFQEFHFKTSERALQHSSAVLNSTTPSHHSNKDLNKLANLSTDGSREPGRPSLICNNASNPDSCQSSHSFKALPLNKKILSSKGDIGIFWNWKKESTVPMEFNFQTEKRFHNNPPIELFNKLSLGCESQSEPKATLSISTAAMGPKENRWGCFHQGNEIMQAAKPKLPLFGAMQKLNTIEEKIKV